MNNTNLVTGFWNIRSDRSESRYLDSLQNVLKLSHNMTIYIPKMYESFVYDNRKTALNKTEIIITELHDIKNNYFSKYWDTTQSIRTNPSWYNSCHWLTAVPQYFSEWYNPIVMSKVFFMYDAYKINKFNSDSFIWIDAGITQHISADLICDTAIDNMAGYIDNTLFPSVDYIGHEVHGFNYSGYKKYTNTIPHWLCRATIFGSNVKSIEKFKNDYSYYLEDTLNRGYMGTEESIFSLLSCVDIDSYNIFYPAGKSMPDLFLKTMKDLTK